VSPSFPSGRADPIAQLAGDRSSIQSRPCCQYRPARPIFPCACSFDQSPVKGFSIFQQQYVHLRFQARGAYSDGGPAARSRVVRAKPCSLHRWPTSMKGMSASFAFTLNRCTSIHERDMYPSPSGAAKLILSSDSLTISLSSGPALVANNFQRAKPFRLRVAIGANNDD
jgi:hypothetical protein